MNTAAIGRATAAAGASFAALIALGGCGPIGDLRLGQDPFLDQSPRNIAKAAFADMREVRSVRVLGSQENKEAGFTRIDLRLDDTNCVGSLTTADGTIRVRKNAEGGWFSADKNFWRSQIGSSSRAEELAKSYADKWTAIGPKNELFNLCDLDEFMDSFALDEEDTGDSIEAGEVVQVGGADAVPVTGQDGKKRVTAWVAVEAPHRVLKMAPARDTGRPDELFFEEFGAKVVVETPADKDVVELPGI